jgi:arylsulfatase A
MTPRSLTWAATAVAVLIAVASTHAGDAPRPNIIVILADDLGYGDVQSLNPQRGKIPTPHLDLLARQGMTFTDAHSGSSVCTPTRYGLLTGRYAWRTRLQRGVLDDYVEPLIAADRLTLPGLLKQQGYHSACIGKWHLGFTVDQPAKKGQFAGAPLGAKTTNGPVMRGFDQFFGFHHARMMKSVFVDDRVTMMIEPVDMLPTLAKCAGEYVAERALTGKPFFLYMPLSSPHTPIVPSKEWQGKSGLGNYADFVMETDWAVGRVIAALEKAGVAENTLVVATSDNGCSPAAGVAALEKQGHFPSAQFRGYKSDIWDGGHRVPFLVRWPAKVKPGSTSAQMVCLTDLMATAAEVVGASLPENAGEDSFSFLPDLLATGRSTRTSIVHHSIEGRFAIREGSLKLCLCRGSGGWSKGGGDETVQLYDLGTDLSEATNLESSRPKDVERLSSLLARIVENGRSNPGKPQKNDVPVQVTGR